MLPQAGIPCSWRAREPTAENNVSHFQTFRRLWFKPLTTAKTPRRQKCHLGVLVEATGFEPTTSCPEPRRNKACMPAAVCLAAWLHGLFLLFPHIRIRVCAGALKKSALGRGAKRRGLNRSTNKNTAERRLNSDKVLFSSARGRERCDRNGHAVFLRPGVDFATTGSEITGISTSSTKLK